MCRPTQEIFSQLVNDIGKGNQRWQYELAQRKTGGTRGIAGVPASDNIYYVARFGIYVPKVFAKDADVGLMRPCYAVRLRGILSFKKTGIRDTWGDEETN